MIRRLLPAMALMIAASSASADELVDQVTSQLAQQGYSEIHITRTFLGRIRIEASADGQYREIILNPRTGEILRDYWDGEDDEAEEGLFRTETARRSGQGADASEEDDSEDDAGEEDAGEEDEAEEDDPDEADEEDDEEDDDEEDDEEDEEDDEEDEEDDE